MNFKKIILLFSIFAVLCSCSSADAAVSDDNLFVNVTSSGPLPEIIKNRMQASIKVIAGQLLDGKDSDEVAVGKDHYEELIKEVFDKILVGYTVSDVEIAPSDDATNVTVSLLPWDDVIKDVDVEIKTDGVSDEIAALAKQDISDINQLFADNLCGLPIDAVDWSNGVLKHSLDAYMAQKLPEFRADFEMETGDITKITVTIYPRMPVIRNIDLMMRSSTVPNIYLLQERIFFENQTDMLLGVPIAFVDRHKDYFSKRLAEELDQEPSFRLLKMHTNIEIRPGEKTTIITHSDAAKYNISIEGWADFGRDDDDDSITYRLHAGQFITPKNEFFTQMFFRPQEAEADWAAGYYYYFNAQWRLGGRYFFDDHDWSVDVRRIFNKKWQARFSYKPSYDNWEGALRYNVHDFISLEYVWQQLDNKRDKWLRLIGHF